MQRIWWWFWIGANAEVKGNNSREIIIPDSFNNSIVPVLWVVITTIYFVYDDNNDCSIQIIEIQKMGCC